MELGATDTKPSPAVKGVAASCDARLSVPALLALATLACYPSLIVEPGGVLYGTFRPPDLGYSDFTMLFPKPFEVLRESLWTDGEWARWNRLSLGGPLVGHPQAAVFYPPNWIMLLVPPHRAITWLAVVHLWWAGMAAYGLARSYGVQPIAAMLAGVAFLAAPKMTAHATLGHYTVLCVLPWVPLTLWAYGRFRDAKPRSLPVLAAVMAFAYLAGFPQLFYYLGLVVVALGSADLLGMLCRGETRTARRWLGRSLQAAGVWCLLVAVDLAPALSHHQWSVRQGGLSLQEADRISLSVGDLAGALNPYWRRIFYPENLIYFGAVPTMLVVAGLCARRDAALLRMTALVLVGSLFVFGTSGGLFTILYHLVPGIGLFRGPSRFLVFVHLGVALLAAFGLEALLQSKPDQRRKLLRWLNLVVVVATVFLLVVCFSLGSGAARAGVSPQSLGEVLRSQVVPACTSPVAWVLWGGAWAAVNGFGLWRRPKAVACGLVILTGLEFALFATRLVKVAPWEEVFWASSVVENLRKDLESGRIWNPALVAGTPTSRVVPELQLVCAGLRYLEGYEPFYFQHQRDFFRALSPLSVERPEGMALSIDRIRQPLLDLAGVRYLLLREDPAPYLPWTRLGTVGAPYGSFSIYVNPGALPRAFVVPEALPAPWDDSSRRALVGIDPRRQVVLDRDVLPSGQRQPFTPARIVRETASTVEVEVELAAAGYLVLADLWMPGWEAWDNGSRVDVLRANHALRAVPLPAGKHRVRWVYWPPWFRTGLLISLAGWTLLILWMLVPSKGVHASFQTRPSNLTTAVGRRVPYQSTTEPSSAS